MHDLSKMISYTDILSSSDIFLDSLVFSIHVLLFVFVPVIVIFAFEIKYKVKKKVQKVR